MLLFIISALKSEHVPGSVTALFLYVSVCDCRQSTLSQLEDQTFNLKNVKDFMINYKLSDIRGGKTMLWKLDKTVQ